MFRIEFLIYKFSPKVAKQALNIFSVKVKHLIKSVQGTIKPDLAASSCPKQMTKALLSVTIFMQLLKSVFD